MTELKNCPFCGGEKARTIHIRDGRKVACICGACGKPEFHGPLDKLDAETRAIAAWNTRSTPDELTSAKATIDRLVGALERSREGWLNAIEFGLIPPRHRNTAQILADEASEALSAAKDGQ